MTDSVRDLFHCVNKSHESLRITRIGDRVRKEAVLDLCGQFMQFHMRILLRWLKSRMLDSGAGCGWGGGWGKTRRIESRRKKLIKQGERLALFFV